MITVSDNYKQQIEYQLRNISSIRVELGIVEPDAAGNSTISNNGQLYLSNVPSIVKQTPIIKRYMTMEHNRFILNGIGVLPPEVGNTITYYQGYVSDMISNNDGTFTTVPYITINFSQLFKFAGLILHFDKILNCYASEINVKAYLNESAIYDKIYNPTTTEFMLEDAIPSSGVCDKIEIYFIKTYPARRRVYFERIIFGIGKIFDDSVITNSEWNRSVDLITTRLSSNSFSFTSMDIGKEYNPENASGYWQYLEQKQLISFFYGYELDDGSIEWVQGGNLFTDAEIKVNSKNAISTVTFSAKSILNMLENLYYKGKYNATPVSLYSIAQDVLTFANLPELKSGMDAYFIDTALQSIYTSVPVPELPINQALQLIANAGSCILYVNREGQIRIERANETVHDFYLSLSKMMETPVISKVPPLLSVTTNYTTVLLSTKEESLSKAENLSFESATQCRFTYSDADSIRYVLTGTLVVTGTPEYYAKSCVITLTGSGKIEFFGKKLNYVTTGLVNSVSNTGYDCAISNKLINNATDSNAYATWIADILKRRNQYVSSDRGYPELDVFDVIKADTLLSTGIDVTITDYKLTYNGALSAEVKFISKEVV